MTSSAVSCYVDISDADREGGTIKLSLVYAESVCFSCTHMKRFNGPQLKPKENKCLPTESSFKDYRERRDEKGRKEQRKASDFASA